VTHIALRERLTVVLLTFNCAHRIDSVVQHLLALDVRVIAVDNASGDETVAVLRRFARVDVVELPRNIGAAGRNEGLRRAATPYVAFCDDDGWWEPDGLAVACDLMDEHPTLAVINARILVGADRYLDPISMEMSESPLVDRVGVPGVPILGFMAGAVVVRVAAFTQVGGYDIRYFMGGEEETIAFPLAQAGWQLRYVPEVGAVHEPSQANASSLRAHALRNTIVNAWLHRRAGSALRWTAFQLADSPKNRDFARGLAMTVRALPWIVRERAPVSRQLDSDIALLDARRFAGRRPFWNRG
jgi:GT2 family glycosyltransferase